MILNPGLPGNLSGPSFKVTSESGAEEARSFDMEVIEASVNVPHRSGTINTSLADDMTERAASKHPLVLALNPLMRAITQLDADVLNQ